MADSRPDTYAHVLTVQGWMLAVIQDLQQRALVHDASKFQEPELSMFDEFRRKLDDVEHDSPSYRKHLGEMGPALEHHYEHNDHHPEHHENGIRGMNLINLMELLCDWLAANARQGGDLRDYISNGAKKRFGYDDTLERLLLNTLDYMGYGDPTSPTG